MARSGGGGDGQGGLARGGGGVATWGEDEQRDIVLP